ncbi:unnamed protein product [Parajaminaea phylloscopi]
MSSQFGTHHETGDPRRRQAQYDAAFLGGAKGAAGGLAAALPTAFVLNRNWAPFRGLTLPLKAFFVTMITVSSGVIAADKAGIAFERSQYSDTGAAVSRRNMSREEQQWAELSTRDKALTWAKENKFSVVAGSWVLSMCGSWLWIQSQPLSFPQKLVQARVYAQGLTLASLVGMAALTSVPSAGDKIIEEHAHASEHSWKDVLGQETLQQPSRGKGEQRADRKEQASGKSPDADKPAKSQ